MKPIVKLTEQQVKSLIERIVSRRVAAAKPKVPLQGEIPPEQFKWPAMEADRAREQLRMPSTSERAYGSLIDLEHPRQRRLNLPIEEAMSTFSQNPGRFKPSMPGGAAKHIFPTEPGGPDDALKMGEGIANQRIVFRNPDPTSGIRRVMQKEIEPPMVEPPVRQPSSQVMESHAIKKQGPEQMKEVMGFALALEDLWTSIGGGRSGMGVMWKDLWKGSALKDKLSNAKDYYVAMAMQYKNHPETMIKMRPRERKLLDRMFESYKGETGVDILKGGE